MGFDVLKELVLNQKVCDIFEGDDLIGGYSRKSLWKHSNAVALLGKLIYRREFRKNGENAYAAGLLHEIGIILEDQFLNEAFRRILKISREENINLLQAEDQVLAYNHASLGKALVDNWDLPGELAESIGMHHHPEQVMASESRLAATLYVADYFCQECGLGFADAPHQDTKRFYECLKRSGMSSLSLELLIKEVKQDIAKMEAQGFF
jgi:putative nucleotidyltransferase with HDIG domain